MKTPLNSTKTPGPGWSGRLMALPVYAAAALTLGFIWVPGFVDVSYEHGGLRLLLYSIFVFACSAGVAILAFRGFMASGLAEMRYAGCGLVATGSSFLLSGLIIGSAKGPNDAITVHNLGVLCGSLFHLAAALQTGQSGASRLGPSGAKTILAYLGVLALVGAFWAATASNLAPAFYLPGKGSTPVRQLVLMTSIGLLCAAAVLLIRNARGRSYRSFCYYGLGLALIGLGLVDGFIAVPGSVLSWTGRISQCLGHLYIFAAFMTAIRIAFRKGMDVQESAAEYYLDSEDHYRTLVNALRAAVISIDPRERVVLWNPKAEDIFGYTQEEAAGKQLSELIAATGAGRESLRIVLASRPERYLDMKLRNKDGTEFPADVMVFAAGGGWKQWTNLIIRDTTDRKQAELALQRERDLLDAVMKATDVMLVYLDRDFNFVWVNHAYAETCRMRPEEMIGKNHFALYPHAENQDIFGRVRDTGEPVFFKDKAFEFPDQPERGVTYWDWSLTPVKDEAGQVQGLVFSLRETTKYKQAELALAESEERLRLAHAAAALGMWMHDVATGDVYLDACAQEHYGTGPVMTVDEILARIHPDDRPFLAATIQAALDPAAAEDRIATEYRLIGAGGAVRWISIAGRVIFEGEAGSRRAVRVYGASQNITERKTAEEALRHSEEALRQTNERLEELVRERTGQLEDSVAALKNEVVVRRKIQTQLHQLSRKSLEALEADRRMVSRELHDSIGGSLAAIKFELEDAAEQAGQGSAGRMKPLAAIISHLKDTIKETKRISANLRPLTLDDLGLLATIESYSRQFSQRYGNICLVREIALEEQEIPDEFKIVVFRVMQEAFTNAAKHSSADTIHVRLRREPAQVVFEVEDNGCGFNASEVFGRSDGISGFGLKSMQERTEICEGVFNIDSKPGSGTRIRVTLPVGDPMPVFTQPGQ